MDDDQVEAVTAEIARVERLAVSLVAQCVTRGVSGEEAVLGLVGAAVSLAAAGGHLQGGVEWVRTALDKVERQYLEAPAR